MRSLASSLAVIIAAWALGVYLLGGQNAGRRQQIEQQEAAEVPQQAQPNSDPRDEIGLCFIIRTYWAHGRAAVDGSAGPLAGMLDMLVQSGHPRCTMVPGMRPLLCSSPPTSDGRRCWR